MLTKIIKKQFSLSQHFIQLEKQYGCNNYSPIPVVIDRGQGIHVYDCEGKQYMDFLAAYSAVNQGHCHPKILKTFIEQAQKVTLTSRAYYNSNLGECQEFLSNTFGYEKVLLMNSGCEAGESAIKFARRWAYTIKGVPENKAKVIFANGNFWGRSIAACGSSDDPSRYRQFGPFGGLGFELIDFNNTEQLEQKFIEDKNIAAFFVEHIQGERGVILPQDGYFKKVRELCDKYNVLLIIDEIQTGLGRTGKLLSHQWDNIRPDIVLLAKALTGGFYPVSAVLTDNEVMDQINPGEHGSTYGGNPLGAKIAITAVKAILEEKMVENSLEMGKIFLQGLKNIKKPFIKESRGRGLFCALEFHEDEKQTAQKFCYKLKNNGLLAKPTHETTIRFSPPLVINRQQVDQALEIIKTSLDQM
ncbi:ornithine aminotransferase, putative [Ichthyophthirius multifiliis]|uniref:Ornithine aminotransferase n=1 Tax=Ichthyophthirius multifiliis TaxID=5932 RepID=G0QXE3_ICHMU|nr:ornithine aminotransferase, putative [Ichthyophthirius multifiliis]EGR30112.1 ornithine aminotransferase, putative [Ichthyophthirius multifiliis]|eukprot:XP_004031348.1 ornithine aminotransferase, putative [Ichthyophthirius multifiliis]